MNNQEFEELQREKHEKRTKAMQKFNELLKQVEHNLCENTVVMFHIKLRILGYLECLCDIGEVNAEDYIYYVSVINDIKHKEPPQGVQFDV